LADALLVNTAELSLAGKKFLFLSLYAWLVMNILRLNSKDKTSYNGVSSSGSYLDAGGGGGGHTALPV